MAEVEAAVEMAPEQAPAEQEAPAEEPAEEAPAAQEAQQEEPKTAPKTARARKTPASKATPATDGPGTDGRAKRERKQASDLPPVSSDQFVSEMSLYRRQELWPHITISRCRWNVSTQCLRRRRSTLSSSR